MTLIAKIIKFSTCN